MGEPIRILHVLQRMEAGGTQALLMNLYRNIDREKIQFDFLVEYPNKQFYDDEIIELGGKIFYNNVRNDYNLIKFQNQVKKIFKVNNYKIIHVHAYTIGFFILKIAKKFGVTVRIAHSHNNNTVKDNKFFFKKILQRIYPIYATDLFACSEEAGKYLFGKRDFNVLKNAIDTSRFLKNMEFRKQIRNELQIEDNYVIGNVGRLHAQKNQIFLLEVFKEIVKNGKKAKLIIIGQGPMEQQIKERIKELGLKDNVILLGNRRDMNRLYQAMDVFVLPSLFEGLGIVAIEAQAAGLPVVASTGVAKEANVTTNITKLDLYKDIQVWVDSILNAKLNQDSNIYESIKNAGYDVMENSKMIQEFYIKKFNT